MNQFSNFLFIGKQITIFMKLSALVFIFFISQYVFSQQTGEIFGLVVDKNTKEPLIGASIFVENSEDGAITDENGKYSISTEPRTLNLTCSYLGYNTIIKYNVVLTSGNIQNIDFELESASTELNEVVVQGVKVNTAKAADLYTPLSVQTLTVEEIRSNPGGNFDVSKVIQALPGVAGTTGNGGFRNDIIIRGGGPNENVYYLDGIEIPVLNHFSTQGSAGGPIGIINTAFTKDIKLSSSAFNAGIDNALSGVFEINQIEGNPKQLQSNIRLSATELAASFDGPINQKSSFLVSARRSYLQLLFELIDLPIRPNYWDFQLKYTHQINSKTKLNVIGIGAIDDFKFANPKNATAENIYIVRSSPFINQWNYTTGLSLNHLLKDGYISASVSRNHFDNSIKKYEDNEKPVVGQETLSSISNEIENKLRIRINKFKKSFSYDYGISIQQVNYSNSFFSILRKEIIDVDGNIVQQGVSYAFNSDIAFYKYGLFIQGGKKFNNGIQLSGGVRSDMNSFTTDGLNGLKTLSPRLSVSLPVKSKISLNAAYGSYYKLPIYTALGFKDENGSFVNKDNKYIRSSHYTLGLEVLPKSSLRFTIEGFYKYYKDYPVSVFNGISLANLGGDFGAIGNEPLTSSGDGISYGIEFLIQKKLVNKLFYTLSYTYFKSEFAGLNGIRLPSAWDNKHLLSLIAGYKIGRQWEAGVKFRYAGGSPYTPFEMEASQKNYLTLGQGILNYNQLNSQRLRAFSQLDFRLDKKWNYSKWTLDLFVDIQNILGTESQSYPNYTFKRNELNTDFESTDGNPLSIDGSNAIPLILDNVSGNLTPTIGLIIEF